MVLGLICVIPTGLVVWIAVSRSSAPVVVAVGPLPGLSYTNIRVASGPWSMHVVRVDRTRPDLEVRSIHAGGGATGLGTLSAQVNRPGAKAGDDGPALPVAGLNGDFYQRDRSHAGDPRGLQVVDGEVLSAPNGTAAFWVTASGELATSNVVSRFEVTWPNGKQSPYGLNGERGWDDLQLYTPAVGPTTRTPRGREWVLEPLPGTPPLVLSMGGLYSVRVRSVGDSGDTPLAPGTWVLSAGPGLARRLPNLEPGATLQLSSASTPGLSGIRQAIGGGPTLVRGGRRVRIAASSDSDDYEVSSMRQRHPRSAVGWNQTHLFLVEVDGRHRGVSVGMTLDELASWMVRLGCQEAMNLDGGGSATLWYSGAVRNNPCDGRERAIANSLVVVRRPTSSSGVPASTWRAGP